MAHPVPNMQQIFLKLSPYTATLGARGVPLEGLETMYLANLIEQDVNHPCQFMAT